MEPPSSGKTGVVRLVVISDTHGHHEMLNAKLPPGDVLIHCGDFCNKGALVDAHNFVSWITNLSGYKEKLVIDGNHDRDLRHPDLMDVASMFQQYAHSQSQCKGDDDGNNNKHYGTTHFLQDEVFQTIDGLCLYGASWASCETGDVSELDRFMGHSSSSSCSVLEAQVDVLLVHSLPWLDERRGRLRSSQRKFAQALSSYDIPLCLGGHVHWRRGVTKLEHGHDENIATATRDTILVNAASLWPGKFSRVGVSKPVVIEYDLSTKQILQIDCEPHPTE